MSASPIKTVCVYCGSSFGTKPSYAQTATRLGEILAAKKWGLVYGGGTTGLMGTVARACATNNGYVHGIIPEALVFRERTDQYLTVSTDKNDTTKRIPDSEQYGKTTLVKDMHTRKRLMAEEADAFVALPGGFGTLEELMEVVTWFQLSIHSKPIIVFNIDGFYDGFLKFIGDAIENGFVSSSNGNIIRVATTPEEVLQIIETFEVPEGRYNLNWDST